jgi:hypothetical protein
MTSALWSTKGRISSPAPNLSPTSFMAGSSTSLSVGTGADLLDGRVDLRLHAVALAAQDVPVQRLLGLHARGRVGRLGLGLRALGLEVLDEDLERVVAAVEDRGRRRACARRRDLAVGRDVVRVDHRQVQPGLDAVVQEDEFRTTRAAGPMPKDTLETPSDVLTPGSSDLIRRMPSIVSTADGFHSSSPVVSVNVSASKISSSGSIPWSRRPAS